MNISDVSARGADRGDADHDARGGWQAAVPASGGAVASIGLAVLIGWSLDLAVLKSIGTGFVAMQPQTALCMTLAGAALATRVPATNRLSWLGAGCAGAVLLIAAQALVQHGRAGTWAPIVCCSRGRSTTSSFRASSPAA
jgi:hypothetical protein